LSRRSQDEGGFITDERIRNRLLRHELAVAAGLVARPVRRNPRHFAEHAS